MATQGEINAYEVKEDRGARDARLKATNEMANRIAAADTKRKQSDQPQGGKEGGR